jgi:hypothetical protein
MKILQTVILSALAVGLMLSSTGSALAVEPPETNTNIFGEVVAIGQLLKKVDSNEGFIDLKTSEGNIRVRVTADTQYRNGSFVDIAAGRRLALVANEVDGTLTATQLLIVPSEPSYKHLVGTITSVSGTRVNASDRQNNSFAFEVQPTIAIDKIEPGQSVTAVVHKDPRLMKLMAIRVVSKGGKSKESGENTNTGTETTSTATTVTAGKVSFVEASPELIKEVYMEMPPQLSREVFIDKPELAEEVWLNMPPELAKEIWMDLPPELAKEIWLELPQKIKEIWIDLPMELATEEIWLDINSEELKQIWMEMPPQLAKEIWMNLPPQLAKEVWMDILPEQVKQIWIHLPAKNVKQVWIDMPTPEAIEVLPGKVESVTVKDRPENNNAKEY